MKLSQKNDAKMSQMQIEMAKRRKKKDLFDKLKSYN